MLQKRDGTPVPGIVRVGDAAAYLYIDVEHLKPGDEVLFQPALPTLYRPVWDLLINDQLVFNAAEDTEHRVQIQYRDGAFHSVLTSSDNVGLTFLPEIDWNPCQSNDLPAYSASADEIITRMIADLADKLEPMREIDSDGFLFHLQFLNASTDCANLPIAICQHGGGGGPRWLNDQQYSEMKRYYSMASDGVKCIYVTLHGRDDCWNMHFQPETAPFIRRLLAALRRKYKADTNRVLLAGFSAGGDSAHALGSVHPDMFSCVNASAGHANDYSYFQRANLPSIVQVGLQDAAYQRNEANVALGIWAHTAQRVFQKQFPHAFMLHFRDGHGLKDCMTQAQVATQIVVHNPAQARFPNCPAIKLTKIADCAVAVTAQASVNAHPLHLFNTLSARARRPAVICVDLDARIIYDPERYKEVPRCCYNVEFAGRTGRVLIEVLEEQKIGVQHCGVRELSFFHFYTNKAEPFTCVTDRGEFQRTPVAVENPADRCVRWMDADMAFSYFLDLTDLLQ